MSLPDTTPSQQNQKRTLNFRLKYKTQVKINLSKKCRYLIENGFCPFNQSCTFAHFEFEIRAKKDIPLNYKTKTCINFSTKGFCVYGDRCQYLHILPQQIQKQRSSSEDLCTRLPLKYRPTNKFWESINHHKRVELIQNLGLDFAIRKSSRLMQLLKDNEKDSEYSTDEEQTEVEVYDSPQKKQKKYSL